MNKFIDNLNFIRTIKKMHDDYLDARDRKDFKKAIKLNQEIYIFNYNDLQKLRGDKLSLLNKEKLSSVSDTDLSSVNRYIDSNIKLLNVLLESGVLMNFEEYKIDEAI